jgi:hypothetical protein
MNYSKPEFEVGSIIRQYRHVTRIIREFIYCKAKSAANKGNARFSILTIAKAIVVSLKSVLPFIIAAFAFHNEELMNNPG